MNALIIIVKSKVFKKIRRKTKKTVIFAGFQKKAVFFSSKNIILMPPNENIDGIVRDWKTMKWKENCIDGFLYMHRKWLAS